VQPLVTMPHQGVPPKQFPPALAKMHLSFQTPSLSRCHPEPRAPGPDLAQFPCIVLEPIRSCRHTGAGEGSAPLQPRVADKVVNGWFPFVVTTQTLLS